MMSTNRIATVVLASAVAAVAASCGKPEGLPARPTEMPVHTVVAQSKTIKRTKSYPGTTASVHPVKISARVTGFLDHALVADGSLVKAGDVLYTIDPRPFQAALDQANASLAQANAQVPGARAARDLAKRDVDRNRPLSESGAVSKQSFDQMTSKLEQSESQLQAAEAQVLAATAQVETAKLNLSYCKVTAPEAGLLGKSAAYEGQMVGPGYTVDLNDIQQLDPMWAEFSPSATEWPLIGGQLAQGAVDANITYGGMASITAKGTVTFVANQVDKSTSTMLLRATFANPNAVFRPGTYVDVQIELGDVPGVVMVPIQALVARETDFFVWRVKSDNTVENVRVKASIREDEMAGISEGLNAGDRIVVTGVQKLRDGSKVVEAPNAGAAAPAPAAETKASETRASETKASDTKASETKASDSKAEKK